MNTFPRKSSSTRWWVLAFALLGNVTVFGAVTIMNTAVPSIQADFGMSDDSRQWVLTLFSLVFGASILVGGRVADTIGLRQSLAIGLVGFAAASFVGGLANSTEVLLIARALQGATGALVASSATGVVSVQFPEGNARQKAFATMGMVMGMGAVTPFLLSGYILEVSDWRWCFYVNIPLALIAATGILATVPVSRGSRKESIPVFQAILLTAAIGLLVFGLDAGSRLGWTNTLTVASIIVAVVLGTLFISISGRASVELIPIELVSDTRRNASFMATFALGAGLFAGMWILTSYLQGALGYSAMEVGFAFVPFAVSAIATSSVLPRFMSGKAGNIPIIAAGLTVTALALATFGWLEPDSRYVTGILPAMLLLGSGANMVMVSASETATRDAGALSGTAGSIVNASQQIGAAIGTAVLTSVALAAQRASNGTATEAQVAGYNVAGLAGASFLILVAAGLMTLFRRTHVNTGKALTTPGD